MKDATSRLVEQFTAIAKNHPYLTLEIGYNKTVDWMVTIEKRLPSESGYEYRKLVTTQDTSCNKACALASRKLNKLFPL